MHDSGYIPLKFKGEFSMRHHGRYERQNRTAEHLMWEALREGDFNDVVRVFTELHPNPDCAEKYDGDTPLVFAVRNGDIAMVQFLIEQGAEVTRPIGYLQFTPLHAAADNGDSAIVCLLLKHGADTNAPTRYGETPLHRAAWGGHNRALAALISADGNIDAQNDMKQTPMHCAISANKPETVRLLLEWNADVALADIEGQNAKQFATKLQDMQHAKNLDKIHEYLDHPDTLHDGAQIKDGFDTAAKRKDPAPKPLNQMPAVTPKKPPAAGPNRS